MVAFLVAGVILGVLARVLHHDPDDPGVPVTLVLGVAGAAAGGAGMNLVLGESLTDLDAWSFTAACILSFVLLGLLEGGVGRKRP
ncbi:hypothetical protein [Nocardioides sp. T2.26MG-1]|uniref:hypothetical protein n=1 Tax=Nocardioides sp. T2.26MG-1 TaxID=3041166 RepID=UPI002477389F|nr:hypothetical protein [Nocardioides sp. T2.26MG-1]CAI9409002.1 hypothetical protein HIDPHFAB_01197 [Nocardioides sp. T2.26MG-1]